MLHQQETSAAFQRYRFPEMVFPIPPTIFLHHFYSSRLWAQSSIKRQLDSLKIIRFIR